MATINMNFHHFRFLFKAALGITILFAFTGSLFTFTVCSIDCKFLVNHIRNHHSFTLTFKQIRNSNIEFPRNSFSPFHFQRDGTQFPVCMSSLWIFFFSLACLMGLSQSFDKVHKPYVSQTQRCTQNPERKLNSNPTFAFVTNKYYYYFYHFIIAMFQISFFELLAEWWLHRSHCCNISLDSWFVSPFVFRFASFCLISCLSTDRK